MAVAELAAPALVPMEAILYLAVWLLSAAVVALLDKVPDHREVLVAALAAALMHLAS